MSLSRKIILSASILFVLGYAFWRHSLLISDINPADMEVYSAFLSRLAAIHGWQSADLALPDRTLSMSTTAELQWEPDELRPNPAAKMETPTEVQKLCGTFCGRDFMRKNAIAWPLRSPVPQIERSPRTRVVDVSRVGFDFWQRRAILTYRVDCGEGSAPCDELGHAFLQRHGDKWNVTELRADAVVKSVFSR